MIDIAGDALADVALEPKDGFQRFIRREPLGVVLVLAPVELSVSGLGERGRSRASWPGNSVILKVSQQTPLVAERYAEAFGKPVFRRVSFSICTRAHDDVDRMIGDGRIAFVSFTGSVEGGCAVQRAASQAVHRGPTSSSAAKIPPTFGRMRRWRRRSKISWTARTSTPASRAARSNGSTCIRTIYDRFRRRLRRADARSIASTIR